MKTRPNRKPSTIWLLRRDPAALPNGYIKTLEGDRVLFVYFGHPGDQQSISLSRTDARLLAKRINQCLDGSVLP